MKKEVEFLAIAKKENKIWFLSHIVIVAIMTIFSFKGRGYWLCAVGISIILLAVADQMDPHYMQNTDSYWMEHTMNMLFVLVLIGFVISVLVDYC